MVDHGNNNMVHDVSNDVSKDDSKDAKLCDMSLYHYIPRTTGTSQLDIHGFCLIGSLVVMWIQLGSRGAMWETQ